MKPTPTENKLPFQAGGFATLAEALDYAAMGDTGFNFHSGSGQLQDVLTYLALKKKAQAIAPRLLALGLERGARVALVADTDPDFIIFFFACQYAGMVPVPLPASNPLGSRSANEAQLKRLLQISGASAAIAPEGFVRFLFKAAKGLNLRFFGTPGMFDAVPENQSAFIPSGPLDPAYIQFTSGSTRFPRGVMITQQAVLANLTAIIENGLSVRPGDRAMSWLPFYHDMGLVGLLLATMAAQLSVDFLKTYDFAMRPGLWPTIMSRNRGTLSFSPPFGYELCARRLENKGSCEYDLSAWRVAGVGAEMIRTEPLGKFAQVFEPCGFDPGAFTACYGMAECSLAVSFAPLSRGLDVECVDGELLAKHSKALPVEYDSTNPRNRLSSFVNCGEVLPGYDIEIRDAHDRLLPERHCGTLFVRGPSVMSGYFGDKAATRKALSPDGWFNTGDLAYRVGNTLVITGREKDMIIINGRNIWPQDLEYLAVEQPGIRNAAAFSVPGVDGWELTVLVIECRINDSEDRSDLLKHLRGLVHAELGIECKIELVPRSTIPRTTSGKLSRSALRADYLKKTDASEHLAYSRALPN